LKVEANGQLPKIGGIVTLKDGEVIGNTLEFEGGVKNDTPREPIGKAVTADNKTLAGNIPQGNYEPGDEYIINVDGTNEYHFYVLSTEGDKVSLIMSRNICNDGNLATDTNTCFVSWVTQNDYETAQGVNDFDRQSTTKGPITAMNYIYEATKNWTNIENVKMNYADGEGGYGRIVTTENTTRITMKDETETVGYENLKARLPMNVEVQNVGCASHGSCPAWLVNGLISQPSYYPEGTKEDIGGLNGYWTLSSYNSTNAYVVFPFGSLDGGFSYGERGVRPVIEVSKSDLS